ncbi:MAG: DUF1905 domain-containing protein [Actinobacteria bacterium]|nr:DUF1905 domain-containing protein [Actinomycetota bacterium]
MTQRFETTVRLEAKTATMFEIPLGVRAAFGRARPPVLVTINGYTYRSTVIMEATRTETRHRRIATAVERLSQGASQE